jgi:hypothetical protein
VAIPSEHGGWGLTLEPVVLGLLVAWSWTGLLLGVAAFTAFLVRTPLKVVAVDRRRGRRLPRTRVAARVAATELVVLLAIVAWCGRQAGWWWLVPAALAAPLVAVQLSFDVRSRGRRMIPELCGAAAMAGASAAIVVVGGGGAALAAGAWIVLAARSIASVPFVRVQIERLHHGDGSLVVSDIAQCTAVAFGLIAVAVDHRLAGGLVALVAMAAAQAVWSRRPAVPAKVLGVRQMALGLGLVLATALAVWV